ncbi:MAG: hypothetical protein EBV06_01810 [Planctomycetia bacterium]|nr:hypothetical protein [Planctomycetia bacterium]
MLVPPNCRRTTQLRQPGPHRSAYLACLDLSLRLLHGDPLIRRSAVEKFARCDPLIEIELLRGWQRPDGVLKLLPLVLDVPDRCLKEESDRLGDVTFEDRDAV